MTGAFLTALLFSLSVIFANRSIAALGSLRANLGRLTLAVVVLGTFAHTAGHGLHGAGLPWFLLSGVIGMGLGDLALYGALPRLGSRLSLLMTQCLAAPIAALAEWLWLDVVLTPAQLIAGLIILAGVALALAPEKKPHTSLASAPSSPPDTAPISAPASADAPSTTRPARIVPTITALGLAFGVLSAAGQGLGAVMSRKASLAAQFAGEPTGGLALGITAAYQRILAGFVLIVLWFSIQTSIASRRRRHIRSTDTPAPVRTWRSYAWVPLNAFSGPILGVSCYQWALATAPSGIVLPIVACTPLVIIPFSYWLEGERPTRRSLLGALIAIAGVIALSSAH